MRALTGAPLHLHGFKCCFVGVCVLLACVRFDGAKVSSKAGSLCSSFFLWLIAFWRPCSFCNAPEGLMHFVFAVSCHAKENEDNYMRVRARRKKSKGKKGMGKTFCNCTTEQRTQKGCAKALTERMACLKIELCVICVHVYRYADTGHSLANAFPHWIQQISRVKLGKLRLIISLARPNGQKSART